MAATLQEKVQAKRGDSPAPGSPAKLADAINVGGDVAPVPAESAPVESEAAQLRRELEALKAEKESLQTRLRLHLASPPTETANRKPPVYGTQPLQAADPAKHAQDGAPDARLAIGFAIDDKGKSIARQLPVDPKDGRVLYLIELPGMKTRVVDPENEVALLLKVCPVWAANEGEAEMAFRRYSGVVSTVQQFRIALAQPVPVA